MKLNLKVSIVVIAAVCLIIGAVGISNAKKYSSRGPWIGVFLQDIDRDLVEAFDLDVKDGALIIDVIDDSPAEEAGLRKRDIIIEFDGQGIVDADELTDLVDDAEIGKKVDVVYIRKGEKQEATIEIGKRPREHRKILTYDAPRSFSKTHTYYFTSDDEGFIGIVIQDLNDQLGEYFGVKDGEGVLITEVYEDSPAEEAGLKAGDVIIGADGEEVAVTHDLQDIISDHEEGDIVEIEYIRHGKKAVVKVEVEEDNTRASAFTVPSIPSIPCIPSVPKIPRMKWYGHDSWDDDEIIIDIDREEFENEMEDLRYELEQMRDELEELRSKLK